jgi:hypothetical protein
MTRRETVMQADETRELGYVAVDSGHISLLDPCNADKVDGMASGINAIDYLFRTDSKVRVGVDVVVPGGDGRYPVHGVYRDGSLVGVYVQFS